MFYQSSKSTLLFIIILFLSVNSQAIDLEAKHESSLYAHLCEVNIQWEKVELAKEYKKAVSFENDILRIQTHLKLVEKELRNSSVEHLSVEQKANRIQYLDHLHNYWSNASFPVNYDFSYRIPYFIDIHGTACAVGQLMIDGGFRQMAVDISSTQNNHYLRDIHHPGIAQWIQHSGLSFDELAWIQPGYNPTTLFELGGTGVDGSILSFTNDGTQLVAAGTFTTMNGVAAQNISVFDGSNWGPIGAGVDGSVYTSSFIDNNLLIGGSFTSSGSTTLNGVAEWDGSTWNAIGSGFNGTVYSIVEYQNEIYAAGSFTSTLSGVPVKYIAKWNGIHWQALNVEVDGPVYSLYVGNNLLYAGGSFTNAGPTVLNNIGSFDGLNWQKLDAGLNSIVKTITQYDGFLFAGGSFSNMNGDTLSGLARWNGSSWNDLTDLFGNYQPNYEINSFANGDDQLIIGGNFAFWPLIGFFADNIVSYRYDTSGYDIMDGYGILDSSVKSMSLFNNQLYLGGEFDSLWLGQMGLGTWVPAGGLARTSFPINSIYDLSTNTFRLDIYPNPSSEVVYLNVPVNNFHGDLTVKVYNQQGQSVLSKEIGNSSEISISKSEIGVGCFIFTLQNSSKTLGSGKLVLE